MKKIILNLIPGVILSFFVIFVFPATVSAHCDTMDGPVVNAAKKALNRDNVNYALIWIKPEDEEKIRKAFKKAKERRKRANNGNENSDMEFFEMLVKVHREGEGENYEGIKPAGNIEPELALADKALETGNIDEITDRLESENSKKIIRHLFQNVTLRKNFDIDNLQKGREYIEKYVTFIHKVEEALKGYVITGGVHHHH